MNLSKILIVLFFATSALAQFTPFQPLPPNPGTLGAKGDILTHDGAADVAKAACLDTEILEYDALDPNGIKCVAKPQNAADLCVAGEYLDGDGTCKTAPNEPAIFVGYAWTDCGVVENVGTSYQVANITPASNCTGSPSGSSGDVTFVKDRVEIIIDSPVKTTGYYEIILESPSASNDGQCLLSFDVGGTTHDDNSNIEYSFIGATTLNFRARTIQTFGTDTAKTVSAIWKDTGTASFCQLGGWRIEVRWSP